MFKEYSSVIACSFFIGNHAYQWFSIAGNGKFDPGSWIDCFRDPSEVLFHFIFSNFRINVADNYNCHQVRTVPCAVETAQCIMGKALDNINFAYWKPVRISGTLQNYRYIFGLHPVLSSQSQPPFFNNNPALLINFIVIKGYLMGPVFQNLKSPVDPLLFIRRNLQHINSLIKTCKSI